MSQNANKKDLPQQSRFLEILMSVLGAMFGVQSPERRERDSKQESIVPFLATAVIMLVVLVVILAEISNFIANHIR